MAAQTAHAAGAGSAETGHFQTAFRLLDTALRSSGCRAAGLGTRAECGWTAGCPSRYLLGFLRTSAALSNRRVPGTYAPEAHVAPAVVQLSRSGSPLLVFPSCRRRVVGSGSL